LEILTIIVITF